MNAFSKKVNFTLRTKLILAISSVLLWLAIANCLQIYLFVGYVREYNAMMKTITLTNAINTELKLQLDEEIRDIVYGKIAFEDASQYALLDAMNNNLNQIENADELGQFEEEIVDVRQSLSTTKEYIDELGEEIKYNLPAEERNITYEYITIITDIVDDQVQQLLHATLTVSEQSKDTIIDHIRRDIIVYAIFFTAVILLSLWFAWYISGNIFKPINQLRKNANQMAKGDLTVEAIAISATNEIGDLCHSYNRMANNLKDIIITVRRTNERVMLSSKDIHQSIQENRFAGEEVANATQTISINLQEQDELIKQAVTTYETLILRYEQILKQSLTIRLHSNRLSQEANEGKGEVNALSNQMKQVKEILAVVNIETAQATNTVLAVDACLNEMKHVIREFHLVTNNMKQPTSDVSYQEKLSHLTDKMDQFTNAAIKTTQHATGHLAMITQNIDSMHHELANNDKEIILEDIFNKINDFTNEIQAEINDSTQDMQTVYQHMDHVRNDIGAIEDRSQMSMTEVISIASMGEEQLTTLEEVSEASSALVERIQKMKDDMRQFKV